MPWQKVVYVLLQNTFSLVVVHWSNKVHWTLPRKARIYEGFSNLDLQGSVQKLVIETAKWKNICFWKPMSTRHLSRATVRGMQSLSFSCSADQITEESHSFTLPTARYTRAWIPTAEQQCTQCLWSGTDHGNVMDEASLQGIFMETPVIQEVKVFLKLHQIIKSCLFVTWLLIYLLFGVKSYILQFAIVQVLFLYYS